ncbi:hypothetical protein C8J57DRAFT_1225684 [Mycena rebaudengoi]|nr:hypothetical protein C8J57DRAFT_1225684 [Mycena rebaudengoi]
MPRESHLLLSKGKPERDYRWNNTTKAEDLRAIKEIYEGQEIEVSYMSDISTYKPPPAYLRSKCGFESLALVLPQSDTHLTGVSWPTMLLFHILIMCEEGYIFEIAVRADDAFELCALYGGADSAQQWEQICRDGYAIHLGTNSDDFKTAQRRVARPQVYQFWQRLGRRSLRVPSSQVLEYFYPRVETARIVMSMSNVGSRPVASIVGLYPQIRCRGAIPGLAIMTPGPKLFCVNGSAKKF